MNKETISKIIADINSDNTKSASSAIKEIRESGNNTLIKKLVSAYIKSSNDEIKGLIHKLLCDLRNQDSSAVLIEVLQSNKFEEAHKMVLSACWESRLDFTDYLEIFIDQVCTQGFEIAFEAFTVIENVENKIESKRKTALIKYTKAKLLKVDLNTNLLAPDMIPIIENYETL